MSTLELYTKGARIWLPDPVNIWQPAEVVKDFKEKLLQVELENGQRQEIKIESPEDLPHLRNPEILIGENDLTSLSYLHEPAVLYNLQVRFCNHNAIYTYCGIVLVAINPYEDLPIYDVDTVMAYRGQAMGDLDPHIFAVAEEAYTQMERENENQSIIVSGESGAGKTMSAKHTMRYFATVGGSSTQTQVEKKVLASNPIMEAIGNAKTTRNDNSSRFGKYIEIGFNNKLNIMGAEMRTYLLEKSRVVFQAADERNYHVFYQLCASAHLEEFKHLQLSSANNFSYTNQGDALDIKGVNDALLFQETRNAFGLLGFSQDQQRKIYRILASILHLGNVQIVTSQKDSECSHVVAGDPHVGVACELLGVDCGMFSNWLCHRQLQSMKDVITKPMTADQALFSRDALSKHIYAKLFDWIVAQINKSLGSDSKVHRFIGVLDIYGFETFEINSFEQFCINYANEKLQQQFNMHVFKLEQEEYVREQIEWKRIDFYDNQPCIDLIESKLGILDLLDEECKMPKGSDETWCLKLYDKCKKWKHFEKPRLSNTAFVIHHFADKVKYETSGFLEKNRDTVLEEQIKILRGSTVDLVADLFDEKGSSSSEGKKLKTITPGRPAAGQQTSSKQHKKTVGSQFRESLCLLMNTLNSTIPHYVRCIKPNDEKQAFSFDARRAVQQLRACGVLETVRISAAGYPSRWTYPDFLTRYRVLSRGPASKSDLKGSCQKILQNVVQDEDKFQFGKTKIFFRAGQVAYLEKLRADKLRACALIVQKQLRGWLQRKRYLQLRKGTILFQSRARGLLARRHAHFLRCTKAATVIQKHVRGFVCRRRYERLCRTALLLQTRARGIWARQRFQELRRNAAAKEIQRHVRGWLCRVAYRRNLKRVVTVQCCIRRFIARRQLKKLKVEARSVEHMKKLNIGLENKIISLQQKIQELTKSKKTLKALEAEFKQVSAQLEQSRAMEASVKESSNKILDLEQRMSSLQVELEQVKTEKQDLFTEKEAIRQEKEQALQAASEANLRLKEDLDRMNELIKANEKDRDELIKKKLDMQKASLLNEFDAERAAYQKTIKENARIEQRCENLQNELVRLQTAGGGGTGGNSLLVAHQRNASDISLLSFRSDAARDDASDIMDEDIGYGSARVKSSEHLKLEDITWDPPSKDVSPAADDRDIKPPVFFLERDKEEGGGVVDVSVTVRLQQRLKEMESEKKRLERQVEHLQATRDTLSPGQEEKATRDSIRLHELEIENSKIKEDLKRLRNIPADDLESFKKEILSQRDALQDELERRREECIQLRTVLANRNAVEISYGNKRNLNEDGELLMAFETQKSLLRQLEAELEHEKVVSKELRSELDQLQGDNERQQKLLSQNLKKTPQAQSEAILQHEVNRLTGENMDLREKNDSLSDQIRKLKRQLKNYAKKLKDGAAAYGPPGTASKRASLVISPHGAEASPMVDLSKEEREGMPSVKHKETEYMGMFEYKKGDEVAVIKGIIYDLKPKMAVELLPGLPAYMIFMCIRHTDHINDDEKVRSLLNTTTYCIKRLIKKKHEDIEYTVMWLANTCRLLHSLKQYSGEVAFQSENTPKQNEQCLRNFDLAEYRQVFSDIAVWIYQGVIKIMEENVQPLIVPAMLEHEAIPGISGNKPIFMRARSSSVAREIDSPVDPQKAVDALLRELNTFYRILNAYGVDPELITQVFKQLFYFICAGALNNLLLRKDMCHWTKGMQIRYNLSHLEQWCRDQKVDHAEVTSTLQPIVQASQLLQARKTDDDAQSICAMCEKLTTAQIIKILNLYTPADEFEERVPVSFIRKMQGFLNERDNAQPDQLQLAQTTLLMDTKHAFSIRFPFNPSSVRLEDIRIPECLNLHPLLRKV